MFQFVRGIALVAAMLLSCGASFAELAREDAANFMMAGCRSLIVGTPFRTGDDAFNRGMCAGIVDTLAFAWVCRPKGGGPMTVEQAVRVVVKYIDDQPARQHESFKVLAREALQAAWPCN